MAMNWSEGCTGVSIGGLFAGESMFYRKTDASKVALVHLARHLGMYPEVRNPGVLLDVQWTTPHLESLGVVPVQRGDYGPPSSRSSGAARAQLAPRKGLNRPCLDSPGLTRHHEL